MRLKNLEEGSFWGRDDLVKRMKDEEKASGMKKFVKIDDNGNHHGVTTSDKEKWEELKAQGYKEDENYFNETNVNEDETDNEKKSAIYNLRMSLQSLKDEVNELADLDNTPNASGRGDLHDQLATMDKLTSSFEAVLGRAYDIVPGDDVIESKKQIDEGYEGAIINALQQHDINGFFNKGTLYIEDGADMNTVEEIVNQTVEIAPEIKPENDYYQIEGKYKNDAQRKAVHASKAELKEEPIQVREGGSPWTTTGKHPEKMTPDELWTEIAVFDEMKDRGEHLSPKDMMRLDSLFSYMDTAEMNEAIKRKADSMMESAMWKAKRQ